MENTYSDTWVVVDFLDHESIDEIYGPFGSGREADQFIISNKKKLHVPWAWYLVSPAKKLMS